MRVRWFLLHPLLLLHALSMVVQCTPSAACFGPDAEVGASITSSTGRAMDQRRGHGCRLVGLWIGPSSPASTSGILISLRSGGGAPEGFLTARPPVLCLTLTLSRSL